MNMFGNSLAGITSLLGEPIVLTHVTGSTYIVATGKPDRTWTQYSSVARIHLITERDTVRLGADLVASTTKIAVISVSQLPTSVRPEVADQLSTGSAIFEILKVIAHVAHGSAYEFECQLAETDDPIPPPI